MDITQSDIVIMHPIMYQSPNDKSGMLEITIKDPINEPRLDYEDGKLVEGQRNSPVLHNKVMK